MKRIGICMVVLTVVLMFLFSCEEQIEGVDQTGFQVRFAALELREVERIEGNTVVIDTVAIEQPALTFGVWIFVDEEYQGLTSTDEPKFFSFPAGSFEMYARSNMRKVSPDTFYSWRRMFTVEDGKTTFLNFHTDTIFRGL